MLPAYGCYKPSRLSGFSPQIEGISFVAKTLIRLIGQRNRFSPQIEGISFVACSGGTTQNVYKGFSPQIERISFVASNKIPVHPGGSNVSVPKSRGFPLLRAEVLVNLEQREVSVPKSRGFPLLLELTSAAEISGYRFQSPNRGDFLCCYSRDLEFDVKWRFQSPNRGDFLCCVG